MGLDFELVLKKLCFLNFLVLIKILYGIGDKNKNKIYCFIVF